ncbi:hypothetical protein ACF1G9_35380 [Streptomyces litmocidini]|uniref:hypothetical protein n=1 Tax=Streptomyces litmocidini TaxID=67318 RepID=UPI0037023D89
MARQLARAMGSFFKDCGCAKPTRCPYPYSIRFRDALGKQREQIHSNTLRPEKLKHRKAGEFREVPLPRLVREAIERHVEKHGTTSEG